MSAKVLYEIQWTRDTFECWSRKPPRRTILRASAHDDCLQIQQFSPLDLTTSEHFHLWLNNWCQCERVRQQEKKLGLTLPATEEHDAHPRG